MTTHGDHVAKKWERIEEQQRESQRRHDASQAAHPPVAYEDLPTRRALRIWHRRRVFRMTWRLPVGIVAWFVAVIVVFAVANAMAGRLYGSAIVIVGGVWFASAVAYAWGD